MLLWGKAEHRGRTSGEAYGTPVAIIAGPDCFYVGLPWGRGMDWVKNLRAAHGGTVAWKGRRYTVTDPTFASREDFVRLPHD